MRKLWKKGRKLSKLWKWPSRRFHSCWEPIFRKKRKTWWEKLKGRRKNMAYIARIDFNRLIVTYPEKFLIWSQLLKNSLLIIFSSHFQEFVHNVWSILRNCIKKYKNNCIRMKNSQLRFLVIRGSCILWFKFYKELSLSILIANL